MDRRRIVQHRDRLPVRPRNLEMTVSGRDIDAARADRFAILGFEGQASGRPPEMLGENGGEGRRHMLRDQDRYLVDHRTEPLQTWSSACGPPVEAPITSTRGLVLAGARSEKVFADVSGSVAVRRLGTGRGDPAGHQGAARPCSKLANFGDQSLTIGLGCDRALCLRLLDAIERTERQRPQRDLGVPARQRRRHDDRKTGLLAQEKRQRRNAIHVRHRDIEQNNIRIGAIQIVERLPPGPQRRQRFRCPVRARASGE